MQVLKWFTFKTNQLTQNTTKWLTVYGNNWISKGKTIFNFFQARAADFVDQLLKKCKQHKGPLTSASELKVLIDAKSPDLKKFLRQEIQYQRVTHHRDAKVRKDVSLSC